MTQKMDFQAYSCSHKKAESQFYLFTTADVILKVLIGNSRRVNFSQL